MELHQIIGDKRILDYITSGNATFTVINEITKGRFTYKFVKQKRSGRFDCKILTRKNNECESSYRFIGMYSKTHGYCWSAKSGIKSSSVSNLALDWFMFNLKEEKLSRYPQVKVYYSGSCGICGRKLTVPSSLKSGFGSKCEKIGIMNGTIIISDKNIDGDLIKNYKNLKQMELFN